MPRTHDRTGTVGIRKRGTRHALPTLGGVFDEAQFWERMDDWVMEQVVLQRLDEPAETWWETHPDYQDSDWDGCD